MTTVTLEEAQARLPELIGRLVGGHEVTITSGGESVARIQKLPRPDEAAGGSDAASESLAPPSQAGCYKLTGFWMSPDFNDPMPEFDEY